MFGVSCQILGGIMSCALTDKGGDAITFHQAEEVCYSNSLKVSTFLFHLSLALLSPLPFLTLTPDSCDHLSGILPSL